MTMKSKTAFVLAGAICGLSGVVVAHHGAAGLFDEEVIEEVTGVVTEWLFVNPHPVLLLEVAGNDGQTTEWEVYFGPGAATIMRRRGFSEETFAVGETVTVFGHPATTTVINGLDVWGAEARVVRADGSVVP